MGALTLLTRLLTETWALFFMMAPYLLMGFLLSGVLYVYLPKERLVRHLGKPGLGAVFKAALFGIPLPLCSCGVIPAALSLRKQGASRGAVVSFMISTPEIGIDSLMAIEMLVAMDKRYKIHIPEEDFKGITNVRDAVATVLLHMTAPPGSKP